MPGRPRRRMYVAAAAAVVAVVLGAVPAFAHGFSSVAHVDLTSPATGHVRAELGLEYDLLVVSAADYEKDDPLFQEGNAAFELGDSAKQAAALADHAGSVVRYVAARFGVTAGGGACTPTQQGDFTIEQREGVPSSWSPCARSSPHSSPPGAAGPDRTRPLASTTPSYRSWALAKHLTSNGQWSVSTGAMLKP